MLHHEVRSPDSWLESAVCGPFNKHGNKHFLFSVSYQQTHRSFHQSGGTNRPVLIIVGVKVMSSERHWMLQGAEGRFLLPRGNCYFWQKVIYLLGHHCEDGRWLQFRLASSNVSLWVTIGPWLVADVIYDACAVKLPLRRVRADVKEADSAGNMAPKLSELPGILHLLHKRRRFCVSFFFFKGHTFKEWSAIYVIYHTKVSNTVLLQVFFYEDL